MSNLRQKRVTRMVRRGRTTWKRPMGPKRSLAGISRTSKKRSAQQCSIRGSLENQTVRRQSCFAVLSEDEGGPKTQVAAPPQVLHGAILRAPLRIPCSISALAAGTIDQGTGAEHDAALAPRWVSAEFGMARRAPSFSRPGWPSGHLCGETGCGC